MKTPVYIIRPSHPGNHRRRAMKPAFINGELRDRSHKGLTKILVYHFTEDGDLLVDLIPVRFVQPVVFELEG